MPQALLELFIIIVVIVASVALHAILQRRFHSDTLRRHNDVAGYLFSAVGVIYAVVLGFVVVVVWEKYDATVANVETEVAATSDLYRVVGGLPNPLRSQVRSELLAYASAMVHVEWPQMASRVLIPRDTTLLERVGGQVDRFAPQTSGQANAQQLAMSQVERLLDARRQRLQQSAPSVPIVLWIALVAGALAMLLFAYLFGVENRPAQLTMTAVLAGLIALLFVVIAEFDSPFSGSVSISSDGWVYLGYHLPTIP
jgi:Protein of unknown function (DUF4239)